MNFERKEEKGSLDREHALRNERRSTPISEQSTEDDVREVLWDAEYGPYKLSPYRIIKDLEADEYVVVDERGKIFGRSREKALCVSRIIDLERKVNTGAQYRDQGRGVDTSLKGRSI